MAEATNQQILEPGMVLRQTYTIREKIASGGMGEVYLADHVRLRGQVAIKILSPRLAADAKAVARFRREAEVLSLVRHPNVVQISDYDTTEAGVPFLVMELLAGNDLAHHVLASGPFPLPRVVKIVHQIAAALAAAHLERVVHGDLKPANVMLVDCQGHSDLVKVLDFGVAQLFGSSTDECEPRNLMLGTPSYMAPEQAECRHNEIDGRADQFALAVLAYVLLTGRDPFPGDSTVEVLSRVIHAEPAPLAGRVAWPAEAVEAVLRRALSKRPEGRYDGILDFATDLERVAAPVASFTTPPAPTSARPPARPRGPSVVQLVRRRAPTGNTTVVAQPPTLFSRVA